MSEHIDPATLTKAALRAAAHLGVSERLPAILGIDEARAATFVHGTAALDPQASEWIAATQLVSVFRSLITLLGDEHKARLWLDTSHHSLGAPPGALLQETTGRDRVLRYLDAVQKYEIKLPPRGEQH